LLDKGEFAVDQFTETQISMGIVDAYHVKLRNALQSDVVIVGPDRQD